MDARLRLWVRVRVRLLGALLVLLGAVRARTKFDLSNKKIVVTGGQSGIGASISRLLVDSGAMVVVIARDEEKFKALKDSIPWLARNRIKFVKADLASAESTRQAGEAAVAACGDVVDALVNCAGIAAATPLQELTISEFDETIAINLRAPFILTQVVASRMIPRKTGRIINISSLVSAFGLAGHSAYCASKSALDSLTRVMALELGCHGISCNTVNPTVVMTEMGRKVWSDPAKGNAVRDQIPLGRFPEPEDCAQLVAFLCCEESAMINGQSIFVDGGIKATLKLK